MYIELGRAPTITETVAVATRSQAVGWGVIVGGMQGETADTFVAELAVGLQAGQLRAGAAYHGEHTVKLNSLLRIQQSGVQGNPVPYAGPFFRQAPAVAGDG